MDHYLQHVIQKLPITNHGGLTEFAVQVYNLDPIDVERVTCNDRKLDIVSSSLSIIVKWKCTYPDDTAMELVRAMELAKMSKQDINSYISSMTEHMPAKIPEISGEIYTILSK